MTDPDQLPALSERSVIRQFLIDYWEGDGDQSMAHSMIFAPSDFEAVRRCVSSFAQQVDWLQQQCDERAELKAKLETAEASLLSAKQPLRAEMAALNKRVTEQNSEILSLRTAIATELSKQEPVARPRLPRIDHFAREAFEKFASGVECELTNYRWFEAGWDARGDTVAAAPLPSAPDTVQVPREPTQDMLYAMAELDGWKRGDREHPMLTRWEDYWVAALAAAPKSTP